MNKHIYLIGGGGVGSLLLPSLTMLVKPKQVTVIDGDTLERKNLSRQLFSLDDIGKNKAQALAERYHCNFIADWYASGLVDHQQSDWLIVCVDNHPSRVTALSQCDFSGASCICAANELHSSEAYYYDPAWQGSELDPRKYYPELASSHAGDPRAVAMGCTGEAQERNVQLVSANFMAASLAQHLFVLWAMEAVKYSEETLERLPFKLVANLSKLETLRVCDVLKKETNDKRKNR